MTTNTSTLASIWRYPVKSFQGESVASCALDHLGIEGDRRFAFRDVVSDKVLSGKHPTLGTQIMRWHAHTADGGVVIQMGDDTYDATDAEAIAARASTELGIEVAFESPRTDPSKYEIEWPDVDEDLALSDVTLDHDMGSMSDPGTFVDLAPLHVLTTASLRHIAALTPDSEITVQRFRPSFVVDVDGEGFVENDWTDRRARLGSAEIAFGSVAPRCVMTTREQPGLERDLGVLKSIAAHNKRDYGGFGNFACLGIYASITTPGTINVGDTLEFLDAP